MQGKEIKVAYINLFIKGYKRKTKKLSNFNIYIVLMFLFFRKQLKKARKTKNQVTLLVIKFNKKRIKRGSFKENNSNIFYTQLQTTGLGGF